MKIILYLQVGSTLFMMGVIWFAQVVHYPLLGRVGKEAFKAYETGNTWKTGWIVIPAMAVEWWTALLLLLDPPLGVSAFQVRLGIGLLAVIGISTALLQGPDHQRLRKGFDPKVHRRLVRTNWIRTLAWTGRALLMFWMLESWIR